ncbi:MAG TPA: hypothetical protein VL463_27340 [Kofleriaceae bacterium]|nr:hypothetical protein [Kofleriaceae bacterium]
MRIACLHLPAFPLQVVLRAAPSFRSRGAAIAVVARTGVSPAVVSCSRAARAAGVSVGMSAAVARMAPGVEIVTADPAAERDAARAVAEALLALSPRVDVGGAPVGAHHAIYAEVPAKMRGATFGARVRDLCDAIGVRGRIGIADDRFTARVAATSSVGEGGVTSVPRGGSAAFLAPLPLSMLSLSAEVRHMLETLGIRTLGEFAALPPPEVARPEDADWHALARGDGGAALASFRPSGPIVERIAIADGELVTAIGDLAVRIAARLEGRAQLAAAIELVLGDDTIEIVPDAPIAEAQALAQLVSARFGGDTAGWPEVIEARVTVIDRDAPVDVDGARDGVVGAPVLAEASAPLVLVPDVVAVVPREPHRRTRRGKERPRIDRRAAVRASAQPALFASLEARAR